MGIYFEYEVGTGRFSGPTRGAKAKSRTVVDDFNISTGLRERTFLIIRVRSFIYLLCSLVIFFVVVMRDTDFFLVENN